MRNRVLGWEKSVEPGFKRLEIVEDRASINFFLNNPNCLIEKKKKLFHQLSPK
jgi:hypothetical protein